MSERYRAGWFLPKQILALTHFVSEASAEDFMGIVKDTEKALAVVDQPFHLIIDNRLIANMELASLAMMLAAMPILNHPQLGWIVMILPEPLAGTAEEMPVQRQDGVALKHVDTLAGAFAFLKSVDRALDWAKQDLTFFG